MKNTQQNKDTHTEALTPTTQSQQGQQGQQGQQNPNQPNNNMGQQAEPELFNESKTANINFPWKDAETFIFADSMDLNFVEDSIIIREDGHLVGAAIATSAMVQDYSGKKVLKDPQELQKACDFARALPITNQHPESKVVMSQTEIKGWTSPPVWDNEKQCITCEVDIFDQKLIDAIETDKKTDVSIGFYCDLDETAGDFNDEKYDSVQRNIVLNHLAAGLKKGHGRCPNGTCGIRTDGVKSCPHSCADCTHKCDNPVDEQETDKTTPVPQGMYELIGGMPDTHNHHVKLDADGNGISTENDSHFHMVEKMKVQLMNGHSHDLVGANKEDDPLTKDEKPIQDETPEPKPEKPVEEPAQDKAEEDEPEKETKEEPKTEEPKVTDSKPQVNEKHIALVDSIMDFDVPNDRAHYEGKTTEDLQEIVDILTSQKKINITAGPSSNRRAVDDAYAELEKKLRG